MASTKKSRYGTKGGKRSKKGKKKGHGRRLSAAARAKLSRKAKRRWNALPAAEKKRRIAKLHRVRPKGKKGKRSKVKAHKTRHLSAAAREKAAKKAKKTKKARKRWEKRHPLAMVDWGKIGRAEKRKQTGFQKVLAAFGIKPAITPKLSEHQRDYLARKRRELEQRRAFAGGPIPASEAYV